MPSSSPSYADLPEAVICNLARFLPSSAARLACKSWMKGLNDSPLRKAVITTQSHTSLVALERLLVRAPSCRKSVWHVQLDEDKVGTFVALDILLATAAGDSSLPQIHLQCLQAGLPSVLKTNLVGTHLTNFRAFWRVNVSQETPFRQVAEALACLRLPDACKSCDLHVNCVRGDDEHQESAELDDVIDYQFPIDTLRPQPFVQFLTVQGLRMHPDTASKFPSVHTVGMDDFAYRLSALRNFRNLTGLYLTAADVVPGVPRIAAELKNLKVFGLEDEGVRDGCILLDQPPGDRCFDTVKYVLYSTSGKNEVMLSRYTSAVRRWFPNAQYVGIKISVSGSPHLGDSDDDSAWNTATNAAIYVYVNGKISGWKWVGQPLLKPVHDRYIFQNNNLIVELAPRYWKNRGVPDRHKQLHCLEFIRHAHWETWPSLFDVL
jgi:hypothetical protein